MRRLLLLALVGSAFAQAPIVVPVATSTGVVVGSGYVKAESRQVVRTVANKVYIFAVDDSPCLATSSPARAVIRAYKGSGSQGSTGLVPTSFAEVDSAHHPIASGAGGVSCQFDSGGGIQNDLFSPDCRLDKSGIVHCAYTAPSSLSAGILWYRTFDTNTDLWGAQTQLATDPNTCGGPSGGWPRWGEVALTLDASDIPYVVYASAATCGTSFTNSMKWTAKTLTGGTTWTTPVSITGSSGTQELYPNMSTAPNGDIHLVWLDASLQAHGTIRWVKFSGGSWGTVETASTGDVNVLAAGDDDQTASVTVDQNNLPHVLFMDGTAGAATTDNFVRHRYRNAGGVWTDNTPPSSNGGLPNSAGTWGTGGINHTPQNYMSSIWEEFLLLGHNTSKTPGPFVYQVGVGTTWTAENVVDPCNTTTSPAGEPGCDGAISARYDPLRDNNTGILDFTYYKEDDGTAGFNHHGTIWYKALQIPTSATYPIVANLWIDTNGGTCTRQVNAGVWVDGQSCSSMQAAQTVASAGDTIIIKNGTYASQSLSTGTKASTVSYYCETYQQCLVAGLTISIDNVAVHGVIASGTGNSRGSFTFEGNHILLDGFQGGGASGGWTGSPTNRKTDITIQNGEFCNNDTALRNSEWDCIAIGYVSFVTFKNNYIHDHYQHSGSNDQTFHNDLISFIFDGGGDHIVFDGNTFNNWPNGGSAIMSSGPLSNWTVQNNYFGVIAPLAGGACGNNFTYGQGTCTGTLVYRNNVQANGCGNLINTAGCTPPSIDISGNIVLTNFFSTCTTTGSAAGGHNVFISSSAINNCGTSNKICTPNWLNGVPSAANNYDIRLSGTDTCAIDAGNPASFAPTDMFGTPRPQGSAPDAGAFEYNPSVGNPPPTAPSALFALVH